MSQDHHNSSLGCLIRSIGEARLASCFRRSVLRRRARKGHVLVQNAIKSRRFEELCPEAKPASFLRWTKSRRMLLRDYGESVQWMFPSTSMPVCNKSPDQERLAAREKALHEAKISLTKVCRWDAWVWPPPPPPALDSYCSGGSQHECSRRASSSGSDQGVHLRAIVSPLACVLLPGAP